MSAQTYVNRFAIWQRIEHWVLVASFTTLALTGIPQKFALAGVSDFIIELLGGIETTRIIHHVAAAIFLLEAVYHMVILGYSLYVKKGKASMMPGIKDITDFIQESLYNLGLRKEHPKMGRFNFVEKMEYLAMLWGLVLMGLTGIMLWNPIAITRVLPGEFIPAAKAAHGAEAVLAVLAILIWHFYSVHIKKWNWSMFNGKLAREEMEKEHALELEAIDAGITGPTLPAVEQKKRLTRYAPVAGILAIVFVFGIYRVLTFEDTAIKTIPPIDGNVAVYSRQTATPLPTRAPTATQAPTAVGQPTQASGTALTWDSGIGQLFADNCSACHGSSGGLSVASYADLMKGGKDGPVIVAGDPAGGQLINKMTGSHPKTFSAEDLAKIVDWIKAGALEK